MGRGRPGSGVEALATSLRVSFTLSGKRCRETLDLKPTPANIKYATRLVADIKKQIANGTFEYATSFPSSKQAPASNHTTFQALAEKWLELHVLEHSTRIVYRNYLKVWCAAFGAKPLATITVEDIKRVIAARVESGTSPKTINNQLDPMRGVFTFAVESGIIKTSPAARVKRLPIQKALPDPFSKDEMERVLVWMQHHAPEEVEAWYAVAFFTGLRPSEQCPLRWEDVVGDRLRVERAFVRGKMKSTKTRRERYVDLSPRAQQRLNGLTSISEFVFATKDGTFHTEISLRTMHVKYWVPCLMELGIRHRSPYHTRHTYATVNLMAGVNPAYISRQLGHSSLALLLSTYSRWLDDADGGAARARMEAAFVQELSTTV